MTVGLRVVGVDLGALRLHERLAQLSLPELEQLVVSEAAGLRALLDVRHRAVRAADGGGYLALRVAGGVGRPHYLSVRGLRFSHGLSHLSRKPRMVIFAMRGRLWKMLNFLRDRCSIFWITPLGK